jgi:hypothetical protein
MRLPDFPTKERMRERSIVLTRGREDYSLDLPEDSQGPSQLYSVVEHFSLEEPPSFPARLVTVTLARTQPLREPEGKGCQATAPR